MNNLEKLYPVLERMLLPFTYHSWSDDDKERPSLPFICYNEAYSHNFIADGKVYLPVKHVQIELYERTRSAEVEGLVEKALDDAEIPWQDTVTYLDDEGCFQIIYEIEV